MQDKLYNSTIALAGLVQAATLVKDIAQTGKVDDKAFEASIYSIFQTDPKNVSEVFNGVAGVKYGLEILVTLFNPTPAPLQTRYMLSLMHLQKKISRSAKIMAKLAHRIQQTKKQVDYFFLTHPTVIANLADTYLESINALKFRVIIWGSQRILNAAENMEKIRALLLAGVRSSVLWRQMGGSRFQLIFSRKKIKATAERILADIEIQKKLSL